jgi:two-component system, OmpR family, alkaline phosphatase synthesis response regulator PhoP
MTNDKRMTKAMNPKMANPKSKNFRLPILDFGFLPSSFVLRHWPFCASVGVRKGAAYNASVSRLLEGNSILALSKILIADDNIQNCELIDAYLSDEGYELSVAYDGQQAMKRVEELQPDLVLLDIMMPKLSGYEVCQWMKSNARTKDIPVLMVTALNEQGDIEKAVRAGCDDFLTKPVNSLELKTRVKSLLRVRHLTNERDRLLAYMADLDAVRSKAETAG